MNLLRRAAVGCVLTAAAIAPASPTQAADELQVVRVTQFEGHPVTAGMFCEVDARIRYVLKFDDGTVVRLPWDVWHFQFGYKLACRPESDSKVRVPVAEVGA